ncbi:NuA4 histone acetyltransferase subunit [Tulasnella sp. 331]|nr:NuA4 histone acetyltransferase subunit [Tulasnella sp. 331]
MLSSSTSMVTALALGLIIIWIVKQAIGYRQNTQRITLPGYRNIGIAGSAFYGLVLPPLISKVEKPYFWARKHLDYERFGWDALSCIYWFGDKPKFHIADPSIIQRISMSRQSFQKPTDIYKPLEIFGRGVITAEGTDWVHHRKVSARAFSEPNMQMVWEQATRIVQDMFDSDWSLQGDKVMLHDVIDFTVNISMLVVMSTGFGQIENWSPNEKPPPGHCLTFRQALHGVTTNLLRRMTLPPWIWGSRASREFLSVAGIAGRGWLGKRVQYAAVAYSELAMYMREMLRDEQSKPHDLKSDNLFGNLVSVLDMFMFLLAGHETTAHALANAFTLLSLYEDEQQLLYDHIQKVLGQRESAFEDVWKLTRVYAVLLETLRLYPSIPRVSKIAMEDAVFSVKAALSESEAAHHVSVDGSNDVYRDIFIPKGSKVFYDVSALHHNPRYWPDPYAFKPDRFLDPNWPRDAFLSFSAGSRSCMGRRFAEVEGITIMALIIHEVSALVLDIGTSSTRFGYAGDDTPRCIVPTSYGYIPRVTTTVGEDGNTVETQGRDLYVGENGVNRWRPGMEVGNPMSESLIYDFSAASDIIEHGYSKVLETQSENHPVLVTEQAWNTPANRERMAEIMFEQFNVPAFYIANNAVLSAFASGRGTALIVDIGKATASVTPVVEGFVLRKGIMHSTVPSLVYNSAHSILAHGDQTRPGIDLLPYQLIDKKQPVEPNMPPRCATRADRVEKTTTSWRNWALQGEVEEWLAACGGVLSKGWSEEAARAWARKSYEFPSGFNSSFGSERFVPGDIYFTNQHLPPLPQGQIHPETLPQLLLSSLRATEPDLRPNLFNNVVLTGGGSLLPGMGDRLSYELQNIAGGQKVRLHISGNSLERRYSAWLGGSILGSLGTFHQLWISKQEWAEHGKAIVGSRCK